MHIKYQNINNETKVEDNDKTIIMDYHDNIDYILKKENDIELLENTIKGKKETLKEVKENINLKDFYFFLTMGLFNTIAGTLIIYLAISGPTISIPILGTVSKLIFSPLILITSILPLIGVLSIKPLIRYFKSKHQKDLLNFEINELESTLLEKREQLADLKTYNANVIPPSETPVFLREYNSLKRKLLKKYLNILKFYYQKRTKLQKEYYNNTLKESIKDPEEYKLIRNLIEKEKITRK